MSATMSKLKQAREALDKWNNEPFSNQIVRDMVLAPHIETILTALNALERMQGVDLSYCLKEKGTMPVMSSTQSGMAVVIDSESFKQFQNAAQTLADIKKEVE